MIFACTFSFSFAQEEQADRVKVEEIPDRFFQVQDEKGFFWQVTGNGAITSGETQYLQSGLNMIVGGEPFEPTEGSILEPAEGGENIEISLSEKRSGFSLTRELWFDLERSGVRVIDTVKSTTSVPQTVSLELRTTYPFAWQSLLGSNGEILAAQPSLALGERDSGLVAHFSSSDGRPDTLFLMASESLERKPSLNASSNSRELTFSHDLVIPAGESRSVVYWILQRNNADPSEVSSYFQPFYQRSKLIRPRVPDDMVATVANFTVESFPSKTNTSPNLRSLLALNRMTDEIGLHRRGENILWMSSINQLSGDVSMEDAVMISSPIIGKAEIPIEEVAAIQGGAGAGRQSKVFLRNGEVMATKSLSGGFSIKISGSESLRKFSFSEINLLLLASAPDDGKAPEGATHFLETVSGEVLAIRGKEAVLDIYGPLGRREIEIADIEEGGVFGSENSALQLLLSDGSFFHSFPGGGSISVARANGEKVDLSNNVIARIWSAGANRLSLRRTDEEWLDFAEVPEEFFEPRSAILVKGNNIFTGELDMPSITLVDSGGRIDVAGEDVDAIRAVTGSSPGELEYEIELVGGERIRGRIENAYLTITNRSEKSRIPVLHLRMFQRNRA